MLTNKVIDSENGSIGFFYGSGHHSRNYSFIDKSSVFDGISVILSSPLFIYPRLSNPLDFIGLFPLLLLASVTLIVRNRGKEGK